MRRYICFCLICITVFSPHVSYAQTYGSPLYSHAQKITDSVAEVPDITTGNHVAIIDDGYDALLLRIHLIRNAKHSISIQTFILANDECGRLVVNELIEAAQRGVEVEMIADHFMSSKDTDYMARIATAHENLSLKIYRPIAGVIDPTALHMLTSSLLLSRSTNQRMHNKIMIFDDMIAITGGRNFDNHYFNHSTNMNFIDRDVMVIGPVIGPIRESFDKYWKYRHSRSCEKLRDVARTVKKKSFKRHNDRKAFDFSGFFTELDQEVNDDTLIRGKFVDSLIPAEKTIFIVDKPGKNGAVSPLGFWGSGRVTRRIRKTFKTTKGNLVIQSPYLIVSSRTNRALKKVKKKGADIIVSTNSFAATDNTLAYSANYKFRANYLEALRMQIYELKPNPKDQLTILPNFEDLKKRSEDKIAAGKETRTPFICVHAKSFVVDDKIAYIGSFNIDPRSDNLNSEVGLLIEDQHVAKKLKKSILNSTKPGNSWVIGKRRIPLNDINYIIEGISGLTPVDVWPLRNTTSFELLPDKEPLSPYHKDFYDNYKDVGSFPEVESLSTKSIITHIYKILGTLALPVL